MRHWQLLLAACWATIALIVAFRHEIGLDLPGFGESRWWLALALSVLLTIWNLVRWNAQRQRWLLLAGQFGGKPSFLGEVWYAESDQPTGPFAE